MAAPGEIFGFAAGFLTGTILTGVMAAFSRLELEEKMEELYAGRGGEQDREYRGYDDETQCEGACGGGEGVPAAQGEGEVPEG